MVCEDFPCCGHDDGLGCDWISPNEIQPCQICIDARVLSPYHSEAKGCPTERKQAEEEAINALDNGAVCQFYEENAIGGCDGYVNSMHNGKPVCFECLVECMEYDRQMQEQYDDFWR
jgi:hypothetical protein